MMVIPDLKGFCFALGLLTFTLPSIGQVYTWVDENGQTHFTQLPPADRPAEKLDVKPSAGIAPVDVEGEVSDLIKEQETSATEAEEEQQKAQQKAEQLAISQENCRIAQQNLKTYQDNPGRRVVDADGNVTRMQEEERQQKISDYQEQINRYCN